MNNLIKSWNGRTIRVRHDRYTSLTDMAQATGKQLGHWTENKSTTAYLEKLSSVLGLPISEIIQIKKGGIPEDQGTWAHPKTARRCSHFVGLGRW